MSAPAVCEPWSRFANPSPSPCGSPIVVEEDGMWAVIPVKSGTLGNSPIVVEEGAWRAVAPGQPRKNWDPATVSRPGQDKASD